MKILLLLGLVSVLQIYCLLASPSPLQEEDGYPRDIYEEDQLDEDDILRWLEEDEEAYEWFTTKIRDAIIAALEDLRIIMKTGDPDLGIPPLDPLYLGNVAFNVTKDENTVYGNLTQSECVDLSTFVTAKVLVGLFALSYEIGLYLEKLELHGTYDMDGHALGMHVFGNGNYTIDLNEVTLSLNLDVKLGKYITVKNLWADLTLKDAKVQFDHLLGGGVIGKLVNDFLGEELPSVLGALEGEVMPPLLDLVKNKTDEFLHQFQIIPDFNFTRNLTDDDINDSGVESGDLSLLIE